MDLSILAPSGTVLVAILDEGLPAPLHAEEAALVAQAVEKRRRDFALGRASAHAALERLGHSSPIIGQGKSGAPLWPAGVVGSITHTRGFAAAIVGRAADHRGLGIDAERPQGMREELWPRLFVEPELAYLARLEASARRQMATIFFSAKEACYKAANPLTDERLDFQSMRIVPGDGAFTAHKMNGDGWSMTGRFVVLDDLVVTTAALVR